VALCQHKQSAPPLIFAHEYFALARGLHAHLLGQCSALLGIQIGAQGRPRHGFGFIQLYHRYHPAAYCANRGLDPESPVSKSQVYREPSRRAGVR
jgi:hypothetical protein